MKDFLKPLSDVVPGRRVEISELRRVVKLTLSDDKDAIRLCDILINTCQDKVAQMILKDFARIRKQFTIKN